MGSIIPPAMIKLITRMLPGEMGNRFRDGLEVLDDPYALHLAVAEVVRKLQEVVDYEHTIGFGGQGLCDCYAPDVDSTERQEGSTKSVPGRPDENREVDSNGSIDETIPDRIFDKGETSPDSDNRHEATVQSSDGNIGTFDED